MWEKDTLWATNEPDKLAVMSSHVLRCTLSWIQWWVWGPRVNEPRTESSCPMSYFHFCHCDKISWWWQQPPASPATFRQEQREINTYSPACFPSYIVWAPLWENSATHSGLGLPIWINNQNNAPTGKPDLDNPSIKTVFPGQSRLYYMDGWTWTTTPLREF